MDPLLYEIEKWPNFAVLVDLRRGIQVMEEEKLAVEVVLYHPVGLAIPSGDDSKRSASAWSLEDQET